METVELLVAVAVEAVVEVLVVVVAVVVATKIKNKMTTKKYYAQHRIGNSGADSSELNICNSILHLCKCWADVFQMPHHRQYVNRYAQCYDDTL